MNAAVTATDPRALATFREIFEAGRPLTYVRSSEEQRISSLLHDAAERFFPAPVPVWTWSLTNGMRSDSAKDAGKDSKTPAGALEFAAAHKGPGIFHLKDFHEAMREPGIRRRLRDLYEECFDTGKFIVISSPIRFIPDELSRNLAYIELSVPDLTELLAFLEEDAKRIAAAGGSVDPNTETRTQIALALLGLTLDEARHAIRRALAHSKTLDSKSVPLLLEEKRMLVNRTGLIQFIPTDLGLEDIGGLEYLKNWVVERRKLFAQRDTISGDIVPKGLLVMGISGCGKSLSAKAIASCFGLPLYRIDMTEIYSGRHGAAEGAFVEACRMLEQIAPAVCWFDEIEMGITSQETAGEQGRMFAFFLTWMQEKARGLFVTATANRIDLLPAEMIRKGRFDEVFFVDLPLDDERVDIFRVHLRRRGADPANFNLERLIRFTKGWTGAEVEQCVVTAFTAARLQDRDLNDEDLLNATASVVPLSKTMKEQVDHIRAWAYDRAVRASPREFAR
jgi:SpoVK/Ycf46/Vps4 family AAA+-type ATPase